MTSNGMEDEIRPMDDRERPTDDALRLGRYHDDEATPDERTRVERTLAASETERETLAFFGALGGGLRHGRPSGAPAGLGSRVMATIRRIADDHPLIRLLPSMRRIAAVAAAAILIVGALWWLGRDASDSIGTVRAGWQAVARPDPIGRGTAPDRFYLPRLDALYRLSGDRPATTEGDDR